MKGYYHMFANGDDARNFITTTEEFKKSFNRFGICAYRTGATVVAASVEDSHPHALLWGTFEECHNFKDLYEDLSKRSIVQQRGSLDGVNLVCELCSITDEQYLRNAAAYVIIQATKDGKAIMPYDYLYGTGSLYFRSSHTILPWLTDDNGQILKTYKISELSVKEKLRLVGSKADLPGDWLVCNGFILPESYVDIRRFENIYRTHNCFRVFLASSKARDEEVRKAMSMQRGILIEDLDARKICQEVCQELFCKQSTRHLDANQRLSLAQHLRKKYQLSFRQLSQLTKLPESELRKYIK